MSTTATKLNERDLLRTLRRARVMLGKNFSRDNYRKLEGFPNEYTFRKHFGSWSGAVNKLEEVHPKFVADPKRQVLLYLNQAQNILGQNFTRDNYRLLKGFPTEYQIVTLFGTWTNALNEMNEKVTA